MAKRIVAPLLALLTVGCSEPIGPNQGGLAVSPAWVTGPAAEALDATNHFTFASMTTGLDELSRAQAVTVAEAFFTTVASSAGNLGAALEEQHGGPIDFAALTTCGRVIPILAPFLPSVVPVEAQFVRNTMAAKYEVEFCQPNGIRAVGVEVAVAAKVTVTAQGTLQFPEPPIINGNEFISFGVPLRPLADRDISYGLWALGPEAAVQAVYTLLRTPIQSVPQATGCLYFLNPCTGHFARFWRMETAEPVPIRRQGATQDELAQVFYVQVGPGANSPGGVYVAASIQPSPAYLVFDVVRDQRTVTDSVLLDLSAPLTMDPFTVARAPLH